MGELINPEFAMNPDPRCACVLLLDTSNSMTGQPITELNEGLRSFQQDLQEDALASRRVEIAIVTFGNGGVTKLQSFVTAGHFSSPDLSAGGQTPMGQAIEFALDMVQERKAEYKRGGVAYYQPWIFMITDGAPTDSWKEAASRVQAGVKDKGLAFFAVGVAGADLEILSQITPRVLRLDGLKFRELFIWLSQSQKRLSTSGPGDQVQLPPVTFGAPVTS